MPSVNRAKPAWLRSSDDGLDDFAQRRLVAGLEPAEGFADQGFLGGEEDGFEHRGFEQPGALPVLDAGLAEAGLRFDLAGDRQQDPIGSGAVMSSAAHHHGRSLLGAGLVGEREAHQHHVAEARAGRRQHRRGYPRLLSGSAR